MSDIAVTGNRAAWQDGRDAAATWQAPDARRVLQLALAALWLLDAVLQYQSAMFTKALSQMLGATASGNPAVIAGPIVWNARLVGQHAAALNTCFATIQLALAFGIAWRPLVRLALGASIAWSLAVWWLGEGLGGVLSGTANPVSGAPGAAVLYALLAVLLWPADRGPGPAPFTAARAVGARAATGLWLVLWAGLAYLAVQPASRAPQALHDEIAGMAEGQPGWLAGIEKTSATLVAHHGLAFSAGLAALSALIAVGVCLPAPAARAVLVLAMAAAAALWVIGQAFGAIFTGSGTDPNSGPLLALLALAYWPASATGPGDGAAVPGERASGPGERASGPGERASGPGEEGAR